MSGMGGAEGIGVLRCAQDDGKNRQRQGQCNGKATGKGNCNGEIQGLSTARRTVRLSGASVEMTLFSWLVVYGVVVCWDWS